MIGFKLKLGLKASQRSKILLYDNSILSVRMKIVTKEWISHGTMMDFDFWKEVDTSWLVQISTLTTGGFCCWDSSWFFYSFYLSSIHYSGDIIHFKSDLIIVSQIGLDNCQAQVQGLGLTLISKVRDMTRKYDFTKLIRSNGYPQRGL